MNSEMQILEKEVVELPATLGGIQTVEADDISEFERKEIKRGEISNAEINFERSRERFSRLKKHLSKRSVSIL